MKKETGAVNFISLDDVITAVSNCCDFCPNQSDELKEAERYSYAANSIRCALVNNADVAPRWFDSKPHGNPIVSAEAEKFGLEILEHMEGWHDREMKARVDHITACYSCGLDPDIQPMGINPRNGKYDFARHFRKLGEIGFDNDEIASFLMYCNIKGLSYSVREKSALNEECASSQSGNGKLRIGNNSKVDVKMYINIRAQEIYDADQNITKKSIAIQLEGEMRGKGWKGERGKYLSVATIERDIPTGLTGGRLRNGRRSRLKDESVSRINAPLIQNADSTSTAKSRP